MGKAEDKSGQFGKLRLDHRITSSTSLTSVGFSMGTGEVTRCIGRYVPDRVRRAVPPVATSCKQAKMIKHAKVAEIAGAPHGLCWTHSDRVNAELVSFVA